MEFEKHCQDRQVEYAFDATRSTEESLRQGSEFASLKIDLPTDYPNISFVPDDTGTIIDLVERANSKR